MPAKCGDAADGLKSLTVGFWITVGVCSAAVRGQEGNGCGHTRLGAESGTLASLNYPGTYPGGAWCRWRLRVPEGRTLRLLFGDFDIESSSDCGNGSLLITGKNGDTGLGPVCGKLSASQKNLTIPSNEATVSFRSGSHRSGRGFLISYATDLHPDLISCLRRGSHFSSPALSVYCPAGCRDVAGDVWGNPEQGYRDTSVLCKSAVHAGAVSDALGGHVSVARQKSLTLYESAFANGVVSKMGSLSEKKLLFIQECKSVLAVSALNASSFRDPGSGAAGVSSAGGFLRWEADADDPDPWMELSLGEKSTITGITTSGSDKNHLESFILLFSRDRRSWRVYKDALSKEKKVFQASSDGHLTVLNSLFPPAVARFVRLRPRTWYGRVAAAVQIRGCAVSKTTPGQNNTSQPPTVVRMAVDPPRPPPPSPSEGPVILETKLASGQPVLVAVGVVLGLLMCGSCLLAGVWWKRRKKAAQMKFSLTTGVQGFQAKSLPAPPSGFISYPQERNVHDTLPEPPLNDYAEPAVGQKVGSTFRPSSDEGYTVPFVFNHYDTPGSLPEYAEPLPPEPEYATPFSEQESVLPVSAGGVQRNTRYDCPSHRMLSNGYCTPALHASGPRPVSCVYAEPKSCYSLLQNHTSGAPSDRAGSDMK